MHSKARSSDETKDGGYINIQFLTDDVPRRILFILWEDFI